MKTLDLDIETGTNIHELSPYHLSLLFLQHNRFATLELLWAITQISAPVHMVTRLRLDAALYQPAPPRQLKQMGRPPRKVGKRLPTIKALGENSYTPWQTVVIKDWYGHSEYTLQFVSHTAN